MAHSRPTSTGQTDTSATAGATTPADPTPADTTPDDTTDRVATPDGTTDRDTTPAQALTLLREGELELVGRMPHASNATFLVRVLDDAGDTAAAAVYKPTRGERPLWDFPAGLHRREIAAFELSDELGWDVIPPTVERDGPYGVGSVQLFVEADFEQHYFTLVTEPRHGADLRTICVFDLVANNTDRKSGHCLLSKWGRIYGIDQGLCFGEHFKLRTVIWDFAGEPLTDEMTATLQRIADGPIERLRPWLTDDELDAVADRAARLAALGKFPDDVSGRSWPWPLV